MFGFRLGATVGSYEVGVSYERGTSVRQAEEELEEKQETLACMVLADNARMTKVTPHPTGVPRP